MKKQTQKKLKLVTESVRVLDPVQLAEVVGGKTTAITCSCPPTQRTLDC